MIIENKLDLPEALVKAMREGGWTDGKYEI